MAINLRAYLEIIRLPNVFTAMADIMAGYFIASHGNIEIKHLGLLLGSSSSLYTGGIVLNDFFDYEIDRNERPERPLPSGRISRSVAGLLGWGLLLSGIILSMGVSKVSSLIALGIALLVIAYNAVAKHISGIGPVNLGLCRYMNFTLGMSPYIIGWDVKILVPVILMVYIIVLTFISLSEAKNLRARLVVKLLLLGIIPLDAIITMFGAGIGYGAVVLMLLIPSYISSKLLYMT